ncbi:MAG: EAL domain-containing protein [Betaproteobacteria bacterium]|nr:EAL domain-containing protein [Betaproteobacteria bacterium]
MSLHPDYKSALRPAIRTLLALAAVLAVFTPAPQLLDIGGIAGQAPLHTLLETAAIVISALVFAVGWGAYDKQRPGNFIVFAAIFLGVALLDFLHVLAYPSMPDFFAPSGEERAAYLRLAASVMAALGLLVVALPAWQPARFIARRRLILAAVLALVALTGWAGLGHPEWMPRTYLRGQGLTPFGALNEAFLMALYLAAAAGLLRKMRVPQAYDVAGLFGAASVMALGEVFFILYPDSADIFNLFSHVCTVIAYACIYKSIFISSVETPYQRLYESREALRVSEERFRNLTQLGSDWYWEQDEHFRFREMSAGIRRRHSIPQRKSIGKTRWDLGALNMDEAAWQQHRQTLERHESFHNFEIKRLGENGKPVYIIISGEPVFDEAGRFSGYRGVATDITERKAAEEKLRLLAMIFESGSEAFLVSDANNRIVAVNRAFTELTGYSKEEVIGETPSILSSGLETERFYAAMWRAIEKTGHWQGEIRDRRKNGEVYPKWMTVDVLKDEQGRITNYIASFSDITERKRADEKIHYLAHHDILTGLPNRMVFSDRLSQVIVKARRHQNRFAVLFVDLDRFKNINDSLGHHIGDLLLQEVAKRLLEAVREADTVCRLGGDEFILLVQDIGTPEHVAAIAGKILTTLSRPYYLEDNDLNLTPSIGIACYPQDGEDEESIVKNADAAMYHAKESGRAQYQFFTEQINANVHDRLSIENDLRKALARDEFVLHFQPKFDIRSRSIAGCEALIRWRHPTLGMISPARFIPIAEETGLIVAIGDWVLEAACREGLRLQAQGFPDLLMSVNVAAPQLKKAGFVERVLEILEKTGLSPAQLELEVTESMIMHDVENVTSILQQLHDAGIQLSIDDFGTGYSSLAYLKRFPIHVLKIDQSFVRDIMTDKDDAAIVQAVIALAHSLRLGVIAEGVETQAQFDFLETHGCNAIQGYLIAKPLTVEKFIQLQGPASALASIPAEGDAALEPEGHAPHPIPALRLQT